MNTTETPTPTHPKRPKREPEFDAYKAREAYAKKILEWLNDDVGL